MNRMTQHILVDDHIRALRREADAGRLVAQARQARQAPRASAKVRQDRPGLSLGFLRRLVDRLVAA
jgi:hypothetical protein